MEVEQTVLAGVILITPDVFADERGWFMESFEEKRYQEALGKDVRFVQDNVSFSRQHVLRGLHYQLPPFAQAKLVSVLSGEVLDVAVDIRHDSPTFGQHVAVKLSSDNHRQLFIPAGLAHGFVVLSETALFSYKCSQYYSKEHERGILWNDPDLGIAWGVTEPIMIEKDRQYPLLKEQERPRA